MKKITMVVFEKLTWRKSIYFLIVINSLSFSQNDPETIFTEIYLTKEWVGPESASISGAGSNLKQTARIRQELPTLLKKYGIVSLLDLPCGDFFWMQSVDLGDCKYIGADIVKPLIEKNILDFSNLQRTFIHLDATKDVPPRADAILCRDMLVHLSYTDIFKALCNFKKSGARFLLTTTHISPNRQNTDIKSGEWRTLNLELSPFNFPKPLLYLVEGCTEQNGIYDDKCLGLWYLSDIFQNTDPLFKDRCLAQIIPMVDFDASLFQNTSSEFIHFKNLELYKFLKNSYEANSPSKVQAASFYKIPRIIHQIWIQGDLPKRYIQFQNTWQNIPGWEYRLWTDKEIRELPLQNLALYDKSTNYGEKSDIARYEILYLFGGIYCDIDFKCLNHSAFDYFNRCYTLYAAVSPVNVGVLCIANGLIAAAPKHPVLKHMIDKLPSTLNPLDPVYLRAGPVPFTNSFVISANQPGFIDVALPPTYFYPLGPSDESILRQTAIKEETIADHYWAGSWK